MLCLVGLKGHGFKNRIRLASLIGLTYENFGEERKWEIWNFFIQIHHFFSIRIGMKMGEEVTLKRNIEKKITNLPLHYYVTEL